MKVDTPKVVQPGAGPAKADSVKLRADEANAGQRADQSGEAARRGAPGALSADQVEVGAASELFSLVEMVKAMPEPGDGVAAIEAAVRDGSYEVDFSALSQRLADGELSDLLGETPETKDDSHDG